ncbi:MAG: PQQ-binding-like beta-propeller repeat protein [Bacteroidetes bacterium]|nr:PQQ-binding-like beta-propeller repeat protein [Bacteroidota bacterium]MBS1930067.1 PQQ-binding-like beta-propeller repeat protein [Bacteroidota bacterium]
MKNIFLFLLTWISIQGCAQQSQNTGMFRDNPQHPGFVSTPDNLVYDTKAWQFNAGSPVRSTVLVIDGVAYFGTAGGVFYAVDKNGGLKWNYKTGKAIHSSAAGVNDKLFFSDNGQTLYCLRRTDGHLIWKTGMGNKLDYSWRFDYYYSSPVIFQNNIYIGSDDGNLYVFNISDGKKKWSFKTKGLVRSTPAIYKNLVLFGDTEGTFYALDATIGNLQWKFKVVGEPDDPATYGFDRKAMLSAPVIVDNKIIFGARDGILYALNGDDGKLVWKMDHVISWVISTVAVKDSFVITGTSDGRFIQAVNLNSGKEIWKYNTPMAVWASPLINNDKVYDGCFDGQLFCLDLKTGRRISEFSTGGMILSSPVLSNGLLYFGSDDGNLYALKGHPPKDVSATRRYVFYDASMPKTYFSSGGDIAIKNYLASDGFKVVNADTLEKIMQDDAAGSVIVFATDYFPKSIYSGNAQSLVRKYLDKGGKVVLAGTNSLFFEIDEPKGIMGLAKNKIDSVLDIHYGPPDTRSFGGLFPCFPNDKGKYFGLPDFWVSTFGIDKKQVDVILGENENGLVSAFAKNYKNGGQLVQLWMNANRPERMDALIKVSEWKVE